MDTQKWLSVIDNVTEYTKKREAIREEEIIKSKSLSKIITLYPVNAIIICNDYLEGTKIIEKLYNKIKLHNGVSFYGANKILVNIEDFKMSSITTMINDDIYRLKGTTINFLLFTNEINDDIMKNVIRNLYSQMPHDDGGVSISRIDQNKI